MIAVLALALFVLERIGVVSSTPLGVLFAFWFAIAGLAMMQAGVQRIIRGLTGRHALPTSFVVPGADIHDHTRTARWWRRGLAAISLVWIGLVVFVLLAQAAGDANRVQSGHASTFTVLGFRITSWGAEDATISWTSANITSDLRPLAGHCLMYFGQSGGTAFFYRPSTHEVFRLPTAVVAVRTHPAACTRS